ncbi:unnamed protein product [Rotaria sp. Silwood1]|nr:unnamed protein product [Rotaria sp. Silwood1]CAF4695051.1 unnamed protein product [Rotaria sp. Silwood1]
MEELGTHLASRMLAAGFTYIINEGIARCSDCGLEVSHWKEDMDPFAVHSERNPDCPFIRSMNFSSSRTVRRRSTLSNEQENFSKRQKIDLESLSNIAFETNLVQQVRRRTFSHWPHSTIPSSVQMIEAGFFHCNINDRVICIYCNLICEQWIPHTDDPYEIHKALSPACMYVKSKLIRPVDSSIIIVNKSLTGTTSGNHSPTSINYSLLRSNDIMFTASCNPAYSEIPKRHASFVTWPNENLPLVDDLVRAGFFYTGTNNIVTCFYCNGSLQNWSSNDNPMIEHARWFPHCSYAKQICGSDLYCKIQESKLVKQEHAGINELQENTDSPNLSNTNVTSYSQQLLIPNESILSRFVTARLDLPMSQDLLNQNFKIFIIKQCWEDQLRIKHEDFVSKYDLFIACVILQKQIEHINGGKENIVIPSIKMQQIKTQTEKTVDVVDFTEDIEKTIEREQSFNRWPHSSPSRLNMMAAGWRLDRTKARDYTNCLYCGVEHNNWNYDDNPRNIHQQLSQNCSFLCSSHPMQLSSVSIKPLHEVFTREKIANDIVQPTSSFILHSKSPYSRPPDREASFINFPSGCPTNIEALVKSGFYYLQTSTWLRCYHCQGLVNDFHQYSSNEINIKHRHRFPNCRFAQLLSEENETRSATNGEETYLFKCDEYLSLISLRKEDVQRPSFSYVQDFNDE